MQKQQKDTVARVLAAIEKVCERERCAEEMLDALLSVATKQEREHRRRGASFTQGQASYKESIKLAAQFFACKWVTQAVFKAEGFKPCRSYYAAADLRTDARLGYAIGEHFRKELRAAIIEYDRKVVLELDYATEIAER